MKFLPERTSYSILLVIVLVVILAVLAGLQYRWSGQISKAENERMHSSLLTSMDQFRRQFHNELQNLGLLVRPDTSILVRKDWKSYATNSSALFQNSGFHLVSNIYLWVPKDSNASQLLKLNRESKSFEEVSWPSNLGSVRSYYSRFFRATFRPDPAMRPFSWTMFYRIPMMVQPLISIPASPEAPDPGFQFSGFLMIELNAQTIYSEVFPELAQKYFKDPEGYLYHVAVVEGQKPQKLLFQSDSSLTIEYFAKYDARLSLFERNRDRFDPPAPRPDQELQAPNGRGPRFAELQRAEPPRGEPRYEEPRLPLGRDPQPRGGQIYQGPNIGSSNRPPDLMRPETSFLSRQRLMGPIRLEDEGSGWELLAKHREGSLNAAVARVRHRNLMISFGSLLLLAVSMALIIVSARRAQRLARLQLDFVAGISHELRTPLAVICAAGDNLAEGVLENPHRSAEYGKLILNEGRKLSGMVEQILQFAKLQRGNHLNNLRAEDLNVVVESALQQMQPAIIAGRFTVEKHLQPGLPRVSIEKAALVRCLQNLIQNALKYSGESHWIAVRTTTASGKRGPEVQLVVEDKGMGIASEDLPHIFEPFYRGVAAAAAQIHGTGLGLFLAREALISMQGDISVKSAPGKGSVFTVHLPALPEPEDNSNTAASRG